MQARVDWVLIIFGTQVIEKKRLVWPVIPDYLSVSYDNDLKYACSILYFSKSNETLKLSCRPLLLYIKFLKNKKRSGASFPASFYT